MEITLYEYFTIRSAILLTLCAFVENHRSSYDLNEKCRSDPTFHVNISPSQPATFILNASRAAETITKDTSSTKHRHFVFTCIFSVKSRQLGSNVTLDVEWKNLGGDCPDYVQITKSDEKLFIELQSSGQHFVTLSGSPSIDFHVSVCILPAKDRYLQISSVTTAPKPTNSTDISSIVLAFMAPFAFILLAVILAVMGSCCCSTTCTKNQSLDSTTNHPSETAMTSSTSQPSGSRDTLFTVTSIVDKPPAYEELFPVGFIYNESALDKLHQNNTNRDVERRRRTARNHDFPADFPTDATDAMDAADAVDAESVGHVGRLTSSGRGFDGAARTQSDVINCSINPNELVVIV